MDEYKTSFENKIDIDNQLYRLFETVFNSSSNIMLILDKDSVIVHMNKSALKAIGKPVNEIVGNNIGVVFNCVEAESACSTSDACKNCNIRNAFNFTVSTGDEKRELYSEMNVWDLDTTMRTLPVLVTTSDISINKEKYVLLTLNDVSELKDFEKQLKKSNGKLREVKNKYKVAFETSPDAINITKYNGEYVDVNEGFVELTGYTKEDVKGKTSFDISIWSDLLERERMLDAFKKNGSVNDMKVVFKCKDGSLKNVSLSAKYVEMKGEPHILSIIREMA